MDEKDEKEKKKLFDRATDVMVLIEDRMFDGDPFDASAWYIPWDQEPERAGNEEGDWITVKLFVPKEIEKRHRRPR